MLEIRENVPIKELVTMRIGGPAKYVISVTSKEEVREAYVFAKDKKLPVFVLGRGANTFARDEGFDGVIILNKIKGITQIKEYSNLIQAEKNTGFAKIKESTGLAQVEKNADLVQQVENEEIALFRGSGGEKWDDFVDYISNLGYSGIEAMAGIPGTVGAAPVQNIGAYGQEIAQVIISAEAYDTETDQFVEILAKDMKMSYRKSIFNSGKNRGRFFIYSVTIKVAKNGIQPPFYRSLQAYVDEHKETDFSPTNIARMVRTVRDSKLPDPEKIASAGSFFKNVYLTDEEAEIAEARGIQVWRNAKEIGPDSPEKRTNLVNSGWLIEEAGLKGKIFHGMRVSDKAGLILINESAKSYADLEKAREEIAEIVFLKFGFRIEQEPDEIGG